MRNRTRTVVSVGAVSFLILSACGDDNAGGEDSVQFTIGGWGGAFDESTLENLAQPWADESEQDIEIGFHAAPGEQGALVRQMAQANNMEWDTVDSLNPEVAFSLYHDGLAAEMPEDVRAELESVLPESMVTSHGMGFSTSAFVVGCHHDHIEEENCPQTMEDIWNVDDFPGERAFVDRPGIMLTAALVADGVPEDEIFPMDLDRAFEKLEEIRPHVRDWYSAGDQFEQLIDQSQVSTFLAWSGRTTNLMDGNDISFVWQDAIHEPAQNFVLADSPNEELAWDYLVHVAHNAQGQADWASTLYYGVPNPEALELMDEETAQALPDHPDNQALMVTPDYEWYAENREEIEQRWAEFLSG